MKLGQKSDKMDKKQLQKNAGQYFQLSKRFLGSKMAKIEQKRPNFMNDPNFGRNFFSMFSNGLIRKVIMLKVKFNAFMKIFPIRRSCMRLFLF